MSTTPFARYGVPFTALPGAAPVYLAEVGAHDWLRIARMVKAEGGRLVSVWGSDSRAHTGHFLISAMYCAAEALCWLRLPAEAGSGYPDLAELFPAAARMQRMLADLLGVPAAGAADTRAWVAHGNWPAGYFPLRHDAGAGADAVATGELQEYPFVEVQGEGVHEIAVGPIHAGIIEPGHFRFSVVGEKVLRLEQRFGYAHKGAGRLFAGKSLADGRALAARISGDSCVAFGWAYCMAAEAASGCLVPQRALWLRALLLERERIANHLGDLGALGNDAGLAIGLAQFMRLKEDWQRVNAALFGQRTLMDSLLPGGVARDLDRDGIALMLAQCERIEQEVRRLRTLYDEHSGLQDRLIGAGRVAPKLAAELGLCGLAGRASAQAWDARADQAIAPYAQLYVRMATHRNGDVAARVAVRFDEIFESLRLLRTCLTQLPGGPVAYPLPPAAPHQAGAGWIEGWRGAVMVALETDAAGRILACHCHDPSWQNWPVLQHAIIGNIVPDFPLINKSFNLSYSGSDL